MEFPCIQCGLCCQNLHEVAELQDFNNGQGKCVHLIGNSCGTYASRPVICNVELMYYSNFATIMSEKEFIRENLKICLKLNQLNGTKDDTAKIELLLSQLNEIESLVGKP